MQGTANCNHYNLCVYLQGIALRICLLLLDVALLSHHAPISAVSSHFVRLSGFLVQKLQNKVDSLHCCLRMGFY